MDKKVKVIVVCIILIWVFLEFLIFRIVYLNVLKPAYISVNAVCGVLDEEEVNRMGYAISGYFNTNDESINVVIPFNRNYFYDFYDYMNYYDRLNQYYESKEYQMTIMHERVHQNQFYHHRLGDCDRKLRLYANEIEAYYIQYIPYKLFILVYG